MLGILFSNRPSIALNNLKLVTHLYTMVAHGAVAAARRAVELARDAPLHAHRYPVDLHATVQRCSEVVLAVLVRWS